MRLVLKKVLINLGVPQVLVRRVVDLDFDEVGKWVEVRGGSLPNRDLFPPTGFIVDGIACGFIYFTNSSVCILDCYLSNPFTDKELRDEALNLITTELIKYAKSHGCKLLKCDTKLDVIKKRALKHGFKPLGAYENFSMEL